MAGICNNSTRKSHGTDSHRVVSGTLDGVAFSFEFEDEWFDNLDWNLPLPIQWQRMTLKQLFILLGLKRLRNGGVQITDFVNRVCNGDEGTNVKVYQFFGPGGAITKTNIGTSYVNIPVGNGGEPIVADFTGCTQYRVRLWANLVGTGQWGARILRVGTADVLHDAPNLGASGERALDTDWQTLPAAFQGLGLVELVAQGKSQTAADDPVFRSMALGLR